jgi:3-deoxy-D-manno-octulosonic-acid transferase
MKAFVKAHWVWISTASLGLLSFLQPSIQAFVGTHPQYAVAVSTVVGVAAAWAKSPQQ